MSNINAEEDFRRLLWFMLGGSRGGENRAKILSAIKSRPSNLNQLAKLIDVDYRSVQHHMSVLRKNNLVLGAGQKYGVVYSIHPYLDFHFDIFQKVCGELGYAATLLDISVANTERRLEKIRKKSEVVTPQIGLAGDVLPL